VHAPVDAEQARELRAPFAPALSEHESGVCPVGLVPHTLRHCAGVVN
jgi:hypothetical protein